MRTLAFVVGALLLVAGGLMASGLLSFTQQETVAKIGPLEVTTTQQKKPDATLGYVLLGAGVVLLVFGATRRK